MKKVFLEVFSLAAMLLASHAAGAVSEWDSVSSGVHFTWASRFVHYGQHAVPQIHHAADTSIIAWKGERVSMLALAYTKDNAPAVGVRFSGKSNTLKALENAGSSVRFVSYVVSDEKRGCGVNDFTSPITMVPDVIEIDKPQRLGGCSVHPVWVTLEIPRNMKAGRLRVGIELFDSASSNVIGSLKLEVEVLNRVLPEPADYRFHSDFWQQPYSVSRFYGFERWSPDHFQALKPYLKFLARSGQKVVTAIMFHEPWGEQSNDKFDAMIKTSYGKEGWHYDYSIFDEYVRLCDSCGINAQINCYSMIPWDKTFQYYDETKGKDVVLRTEVGIEPYKWIWVPFIKSFAAHLKEMGWFDKTCIAMDERPMEDMLQAYNVLKEAEPDFKMALAGTYHPELADKLYDYCVGWQEHFTPEELNMRKGRGWVSTTYTCCPHLRPNLETYNTPAECAFLPVYCIANGFDGYLHWSWMNWTDDPLNDTRFKFFPPGDTYLIYPGDLSLPGSEVRSAVRYESYIEGVQQAEKICILREAASSTVSARKYLDKIESCLSQFVSGNLPDDETSARLMIQLESLLNKK